jgi:hypothetical protein
MDVACFNLLGMRTVKIRLADSTHSPRSRAAPTQSQRESPRALTTVAFAIDETANRASDGHDKPDPRSSCGGQILSVGAVHQRDGNPGGDAEYQAAERPRH